MFISLACNRVTQNRAFDTEAASSSYATGFVVDKKRGIILTNRHVLTPGNDLYHYLNPICADFKPFTLALDFLAKLNLIL